LQIQLAEAKQKIERIQKQCSLPDRDTPERLVFEMPVSGIVSHLAVKSGGNIHNKEVLEMSASSILSGEHGTPPVSGTNIPFYPRTTKLTSGFALTSMVSQSRQYTTRSVHSAVTRITLT
jgi:hypothetical protein